MWRSAQACLLPSLAFCTTPLVAQTPVGDLTTPDAGVQGAVVTTAQGTRVVSGSTVSAGATTAAVRLLRGGQVRICPNSSISLSTSPDGQQLMLALGTGSIETHYSLAASADTIITPDFRILLAGPGEFHFAVAADARGNTCVRTLPGNSAALIVNELLGNGVYQVRAQDQVLFRNGSLQDSSPLVPPDCGCPPPVQNLLAEAQPIPPLHFPAAAPARTPPQPNPVPPPPDAGELHIEVDAPFVFRATAPDIPPPPVTAHLQLQSLPPLLMQTPVLPPPSKATPQAALNPAKPAAAKKGFFRRVRSFFATIFH